MYISAEYRISCEHIPSSDKREEKRPELNALEAMWP